MLNTLSWLMFLSLSHIHSYSPLYCCCSDPIPRACFAWHKVLCSHVPSLSQYFPLTLCKASSVLWLHPSSLCMATCESQSPHRLNPLCSPFWLPPACLSTCSPCDTGLSWTALPGTLGVTVTGTVSLWSFALCGISCWRKVIRAPQSL